MLRLATVAGVVAAAAADTITVSFNATTAAYTGLPDTYLGVTIDTASIYALFDFTDPVLINLVKQMAPAVLRIGGTASDNSIYTGAGGAHGVGPNGAVAIDNAYWDQINAFQAATGVKILWDLCRQTDAAGAYDPSINATALFEYTQAQGYTVDAWEVGNELTAVSASQYIADLVALRKALSGYKVGQVISGPSTCCNPMSWVQDFMAAGQKAGVPDLLSMHDYPLTACTLAEFTSKSAVDGIRGTLSAFRDARDQYYPGLALNLEETATKSGGGCDGLSNRYASGFYYLRTIGLVGEHGYASMNRQDMAGYSFVGRVSHYTLAGPPGWTNGSAALTPHPDWFTHILWKQLMGLTVLSSQQNGTNSLVDSFGTHVWCSTAGAGPAGSISVAYINFNDSDVTVTVAGVPAAPRVEYVLTADATAYEVSRHMGNQALHDPPPYLTNDTIFANGQLLTVDATGMLPVYPIPGKSVSDPSTPFIAPAYSYGFIVFPGANVAACM